MALKTSNPCSSTPNSSFRTLVTGGDGFIGSNIINRLLEQGSLPVVLDDLMKLYNFGICFIDLPGFLSFIALERNAFCVLSNRGTVQEECCIFKVTNVTLRDVTERPETIECGSNILSGAEPDAVLSCVKTVLSQPSDWTPPREYLEKDVSEIVLKIIQGYHQLSNA